MNIGFIGTGTMGARLARHLLAEHRLIVFDADPAAMAPLVEAGAVASRSVADVAARAPAVVFLSLPGPDEIRAVVAGEGGLLESLRTGSVICDLSTSSVECARELAKRCAAGGIAFVDAPVSGGPVGAERGTLSVMVGAEPGAFEQVEPLLRRFARHVFHLGPPAAGALVKLINNQIFLCASVLIQEGFVLGAKAGMDASKLLEILNVSSAGLLTSRTSFMLSRDFDDPLFKLGIAAKDVSLAVASAKALGVSMPTTEGALGVYLDAVSQGLGEANFAATLLALESRARAEVAALKKRESGAVVHETGGSHE